MLTLRGRTGSVLGGERKRMVVLASRRDRSNRRSSDAGPSANRSAIPSSSPPRPERGARRAAHRASAAGGVLKLERERGNNSGTHSPPGELTYLRTTRSPTRRKVRFFKDLDMHDSYSSQPNDSSRQTSTAAQT